MTDAASNQGETNTPNDPAANAVAELKSKVDQLVADNARLQGRVDQFDRMRPVQTAPQVSAPQRQLTPEQYNELMAKNPAEAIKLAVRDVVQEEVAPLVKDAERKNSRERWDEKAKTDFPAMASDPEFQRAVEDKVKELVQVDQRSPNDPTLVYRAAELASVRFSNKKALAKSSGGLSGEAPTNTRDESASSKFKKPEYFDTFSDVFGMSKDSRGRLEAKMQKAANAPSQRRSR